MIRAKNSHIFTCGQITAIFNNNITSFFSQHNILWFALIGFPRRRHGSKKAYTSIGTVEWTLMAFFKRRNMSFFLEEIIPQRTGNAYRPTRIRLSYPSLHTWSIGERSRLPTLVDAQISQLRQKAVLRSHAHWQDGNWGGGGLVDLCNYKEDHQGELLVGYNEARLMLKVCIYTQIF